MTNAPEAFIFFQISSKEAKEAFTFHQSLTDEHIWPRTEEQIEQFCNDGELYGVRKASSGEYVGLCYAHLDEETGEWELGGLAVSDAARHLRIGSILTLFSLAHTIAHQRPWTYGQEIIAHVHEANEKPRNVLARIGFEHVGKITVPEEIAPKSMKRNDKGKIIGDKFRFDRTKVCQLLKWFEEFRGILADGVSPAMFEVRPGGTGSLIEALREAAKEYSPNEM